MSQLATPTRKLRILVVEDNIDRVSQFKIWAAEVVFIHVDSAGMAIGCIRRTKPNEIHGILLDHDLQMNAHGEADHRFSGNDVVPAIIDQFKSATMPVLIHSMNDREAPNMERKLAAAGFPVTRTPMAALTQAAFRAWIDEVQDDAGT